MRELARRSGMSHTAVAVVINGQRDPTWEFCAKIADALKMPKTELFRMAGLMEPIPEDTADEEELIYLARLLRRHDRRNLLIYAKALVEAEAQETSSRVVALGELPGANFGNVNKFDEFGPGAEPGDRGEPRTCETCGSVLD